MTPFSPRSLEPILSNNLVISLLFYGADLQLNTPRFLAVFRSLCSALSLSEEKETTCTLHPSPTVEPSAYYTPFLLGLTTGTAHQLIERILI